MWKYEIPRTNFLTDIQQSGHNRKFIFNEGPFIHMEIFDFTYWFWAVPKIYFKKKKKSIFIVMRLRCLPTNLASRELVMFQISALLVPIHKYL